MIKSLHALRSQIILFKRVKKKYGVAHSRQGKGGTCANIFATFWSETPCVGKIHWICTLVDIASTRKRSNYKRAKKSCKNLRMNDWCLEYFPQSQRFVVVGTGVRKKKPTMAGEECGHHMHIWRLNDVDVGVIAVRICLKRDRLLNRINNFIYSISSQRRVRSLFPHGSGKVQVFRIKQKCHAAKPIYETDSVAAKKSHNTADKRNTTITKAATSTKGKYFRWTMWMEHATKRVENGTIRCHREWRMQECDWRKALNQCRFKSLKTTIEIIFDGIIHQSIQWHELIVPAFTLAKQLFSLTVGVAFEWIESNWVQHTFILRHRKLRHTARNLIISHHITMLDNDRQQHFQINLSARFCVCYWKMSTATGEEIKFAKILAQIHHLPVCLVRKYYYLYMLSKWTPNMRVKIHFFPLNTSRSLVNLIKFSVKLILAASVKSKPLNDFQFSTSNKNGCWVEIWSGCPIRKSFGMQRM